MDPAQIAYLDAVNYFKSTLTNDEWKKSWIDTKSSLEDVQVALSTARSKYESSKQSRARLWLAKFSSRVMYYAAILDTLSEHHPEYVSLVWGAMKFLFIGVLNQEELITQLSRALSKIADLLPRVKIQAALYQTPTMRHAVSMLYSRIIQFFCRAISWYKESKFKHMITAFTRPASLRFKDLIEGIAECSDIVHKTAETSAQLELRNVYERQETIQTTVKGLKDDFKTLVAGNMNLEALYEGQKHIVAVLETMENRILCRLQDHENINNSRFINTNQKLSQIQYSQILSVLAITTLPQPEAALRFWLSLRKQRELDRTAGPHATIVLSKLQTWAVSPGCVMILIEGNSATKHRAQSLVLDVIELVRTTPYPILWALESSKKKAVTDISMVDILKLLVLQVLHLNTTLMNEKMLSINQLRFHTSTTESQWLDLLVSVLTGIPFLFMVIDTELTTTHLESSTSWPLVFNKLFKKLKEVEARTVVKVVFVSCRRSLQLKPTARKKWKLDVISMKEVGVVAPVSCVNGHSIAVRSTRAPQRSRAGLSALKSHLSLLDKKMPQSQS